MGIGTSGSEVMPIGTERQQDTMEFEVLQLNAADYRRSEDEMVSSGEVMIRHLAATEPAGFTYADVGSFNYPRLRLTDEERREFLEGLRPVLKAVLEATEDADDEDDWIKRLTTLVPTASESQEESGPTTAAGPHALHGSHDMD